MSVFANTGIFLHFMQVAPIFDIGMKSFKSVVEGINSLQNATGDRG